MNYDLCIIGAGPAGYSGAVRAARAGLKVALVEKDRVGGTCLNRGCIPTKALRHCADLLVQARQAEKFGVKTGEIGFDFAAAAAHRDRVTRELASGVEALVKAGGVDLVTGGARLSAPGKVLVSGGEKTIECSHTVIATGARPADLPGIRMDENRVVSSEGALKWNELPESVIVVGGGVIGCEFADMFATFGVRVTVIEVMDRILLGEDKRTAKAVHKALAKRGVEFRLAAAVEDLSAAEGAVACSLSGGESLRAERAVVCVGRRPVIEDLGLEDAGVETEAGAIKVDEKGRTSAERIWAAGDVTGQPMLAHAASQEMECVIGNITGESRRFDRECIPSVVFVRPELASVGLNEDRAGKDGVPVEVGRMAYATNGKALCMGEPEGMVKVLAEKGGGRVLGGTVMGAHASDLVAELTLAVKNRLTVRELVETVHAHPTLSELIMEAAADSMGMAVHKASRRDRRKSAE